MNNERTRVEITGNGYGDGDVRVNYETIKKIPCSDFGDILEQLDKRIYFQWADGCNIFFFTQRQYAKFLKLLNEEEN